MSTLITREQAYAIAEAFLRQGRSPPDWEGIDRVLSPEELRALTPVYVAGPDSKWATSWIAYVRRAPRVGGSAAILVSQRTGQVVFAGAVSDE